MEERIVLMSFYHSPHCDSLANRMERHVITHHIRDKSYHCPQFEFRWGRKESQSEKHVI